MIKYCLQKIKKKKKTFMNSNCSRVNCKVVLKRLTLFRKYTVFTFYLFSTMLCHHVLWIVKVFYLCWQQFVSSYWRSFAILENSFDKSCKFLQRVAGTQFRSNQSNKEKTANRNSEVFPKLNQAPCWRNNQKKKNIFPVQSGLQHNKYKAYILVSSFSFWCFLSQLKLLSSWVKVF